MNLKIMIAVLIVLFPFIFMIKKTSSNVNNKLIIYTIIYEILVTIIASIVLEIPDDVIKSKNDRIIEKNMQSLKFYQKTMITMKQLLEFQKL